MERWQKVSFALVGATLVALAAFSAGFALGNDGGSAIPFVGGDESDGLDLVDGVFQRISSAAVDAPSSKELARGAIKGMVKVLKQTEDPYAAFYSPSDYTEFQQYTSGRFSGIGVWLKEQRGELEIVSVLPSSPAVEAGLERGDLIVTVDGLAVDNLSADEAVGRIKGPAGTDVSIEVERRGEAMSFDLTRESIDLPNLISRVAGGELGYIRLFGFARGAGTQVRERVQKLTEGGAEGILLDLRDNGGGLVSEAVDVASVFIEEGDIVTYREKENPDVVYEAEGGAFGDVPLVVLVNEGTASASEIVAGALQDRDRAILVGNQTYGKGSVQNIFPLPDQSALKLTTGAYLTPDGRDISGRGIEPDVEVDAEPPVQKTRAEEILKGIVVSTTGAQG
ncbi:MAG: S41 family peptidase [Actinobacteria bacterium]|nr:S41 family peptidase [Actinomycetota bacterium]